MRDTAIELTALCEAWQAPDLDLQGCARRFLHVLGWEFPLPFSPGEAVEATGTVPFLLRADTGTALAALFVRPGKMEPPSALVDRGLDFCRMTRLLVNGMRGLNVRYLLITDMSHAYVYDVHDDALLLYADDPREFDEEVAPEVRRSAVCRGSLDALRRPPRSVMARQLREWRTFWVSQFVKCAGCPEPSAQTLIDRILVARFIFGHKVFRRTRSHFEKRFAELTRACWKGQIDGCGPQLSSIFHDMWFDWRIDLFEPDTALDRALTIDALTARIVVDASLISQSKIDVSTILESFNYGDPQEKMRVRMVPDSNEDREHYMATQSLSSIDDARILVDLQEEGYRAIFLWFDRVVSLYERFALDFEEQHQGERTLNEGMDLFTWSAVDASRPDACGDVLAYACTHGFGILYGDQRQLQIARLLFTMHLIHQYGARKQPVERFPNLSAVFEQRPEVMRADQVLYKRGPAGPRKLVTE
jgi:hypothetical protein